MNTLLVACLACVFGVAIGCAVATHILTRHFDARLKARDDEWRMALGDEVSNSTTDRAMP